MIRFIELEKFTSHDSFRLDLPEAGIVVITGTNGAGKSSLLEGVAWGLWGQTLRGTGRSSWVPWRDGANPPCVARVGLADTVAERKRKGEKTSLRLDANDKFATVTAAQPRLTALVGSFDAWKKSNVFSSADAAHFTLASDRARKDLLEEMCGLRAFDGPLERCDDDRREQKSKICATEVAIGAWGVQSELAMQQLKTAQEELGFLLQPAVVAKPTARSAGIATELHDVQNKMRALQKEIRRIEESEAEIEVSGICPTCGQPLPDVHTEECPKVDVTSLAREKKELTDAFNALAVLEHDLSGLWYEARMAENAHQRYTLEKERHDQSKGRLIQMETRAKAELERLEARGMGLHNTLAQAKRDQMLATLAEQAMQGTRGAVLARTLGGLEELANAYLAMVPNREDNSIQVQLGPYSERKDGRLADAISLDVLGAGGASGYHGCSGGERRRVDVAMVLAFASLAGGAGPLWFDEVFDQLDDAGTIGVVEVLQYLAKGRCIVVITHSGALLEKVKGAKHVHVGLRRGTA